MTSGAAGAAPGPPPRYAPRRARRGDGAPRVALVLGGGGLKGFAHIGVLRALAERGVRPSVYAGTSIGALVAAAAAGGRSADDMERRAVALTRRDLFRLEHYRVLVGQLRAPSLYDPAPLRALVDQVVPGGTFEELRAPLLVNTVDVAAATQVVWGLRGLRDVSVRDAVYASCALPGFFPPGHVGGRPCVDGGTVDNLPLGAAAFGSGGRVPDLVVAVDVGNVEIATEHAIVAQGFAAVFMRAAQVMMRALQGGTLARWQGPPVLLVRPKVAHLHWFAFGRAAEVVEAGYRAAVEAFEQFDAALAAPGGIWPRRSVRVVVNRERCTGCGLCVALAPHTMALDAERKAVPLRPAFAWSPADGGFIKQCPVDALASERVDVSPTSLPDPPESATPDAALGAGEPLAADR